MPLYPWGYIPDENPDQALELYEGTSPNNDFIQLALDEQKYEWLPPFLQKISLAETKWENQLFLDGKPAPRKGEPGYKVYRKKTARNLIQWAIDFGEYDILPPALQEVAKEQYRCKYEETTERMESTTPEELALADKFGKELTKKAKR